MLLESFDNLEVPWLYHNGTLYTAGGCETLRVGDSLTPMKTVRNIGQKETAVSASQVLKKNRFYSLGSSLEEVVANKYHEETYPYEALAMNLARGGSVLQDVLRTNIFGFKRQLYECVSGTGSEFQGKSFCLVYKGSTNALHKKYADALLHQAYTPQSSLSFDSSYARVTLEPFTMRHQNQDYLMDGCTFHIEYDKHAKMIQYPRVEGSANNPFVHQGGNICLSEAVEWKRREVVPEKRIENFAQGLSWALIETARMLRTGYSPKVAVVNSLSEFSQGRQGGIFVN